MNALDKFIGVFSPERAIRRMMARQAMAHYEGASHAERMSGWNAARGTSANREVQNGLGTLRDRSRDLVRNNWAAAKAVEVVQNNTIGHGIKPSCNIPELDELVQAFAMLTKFLKPWERWFFEARSCSDLTPRMR